MTQSLGNMVACEALREGLQVSQYYMFDAALASESIDPSSRVESEEDAGFTKHVRPEWRDYTNACWASNWYRFFEDDPTDARGKMKWPGRFTDALANATEVFNYYSSGDAVFTETDEVPWLLKDVLGVDLRFWTVLPYLVPSLSFETHCWQKQEVLKGTVGLAGTVSGGWGFYSWLEHHEDPLTDEHTFERKIFTSQQANEKITDGSVKNRPVFDVSGAAEMMNHDAPEEDVFLALAKHVPALSSPVGGNAIGKLVNNIDMNDSDDGVPRPNGWGRRPIGGEQPWQHSDMKDVAYYFVYRLYDQLVTEKGHLDEKGN